MRFCDERTRPSVDLVNRIKVANPQNVIDLGCGPGNSTQILRKRWPDARIVGLDSSAEMIETARSEMPAIEWTLSNIEDWQPEAPYDVVFSNAALQWIPKHALLLESLFANVTLGGALAFQIPSSEFPAVRLLIHEIAQAGERFVEMANLYCQYYDNREIIKGGRLIDYSTSASINCCSLTCLPRCL